MYPAAQPLSLPHQASSSLDPTFWPIHPTIDRLWQYSVLTESVTNVHWPDADYSYTGPDGSNVTECISLYSATCEGHGGSDIFPFGKCPRTTLR